MIEGLKPYPKYKDSRQAWLGVVPAHWSLLPNRALFDEVKDRDHPEEEMLSVTITRGIVRQQALLENSSKKDSSNTNKSAYKLIYPGDIAYNKMRAWQGALGASSLRGIISPAYVVMRPRKEANARFFHYLYRTALFAKEAERWSYGITSDMWSLRPEHFKVIGSVLPPPDEQLAIVRFLDHANRKIDGFIRAKRKLIGLLNEQKQAIIHRAVTRGLDPNAKLKPSGIPWLGEIPEHWEVRRVKQVTKILRGKFTHRPRNDPSLYDGPYPFIQTGAVARAKKFITEYKQTLNERGLAVSKLFPKGTLCMTIAANIGDVAILDFEACFPDSIVGFVPSSGLNRDFLYLAFLCLKTELLSDAPINTQGNLNVERIGVKWLPFPPLEEQKQIAAQVELETSVFATAIARTEREIALMQEYRTRLTADIVTGKLNVREAAAKLPEEKEEEFVDSEIPEDETETEEFAE
jgi:type I restriction enzyme S subunit